MPVKVAINYATFLCEDGASLILGHSPEWWR